MQPVRSAAFWFTDEAETPPDIHFTLLLLCSPAISLGFTILLCSPAISLGFTILLCFPAISLGFTILGEIFAYVTFFVFVLSNHSGSHMPLPGWFMLSVFLLLAFAHPGHECQDLFSPCDGIYTQTRPCLDLYSHPTLFGEWSHDNSQGKIPSTGKILVRGGLNP